MGGSLLADKHILTLLSQPNMPWVNETTADSPGSRNFHAILKNALLRRIPADQLTAPLRTLHSQYPLSADEIAGLLIGFRAHNTATDDPLLFTYADALLQFRLVTAESLLSALLNTSRFAKWKDGVKPDDPPSTGMPTCEERMFNMLTQKYLAGVLPMEPRNFHPLLWAFARWFHAVKDYEVSRQLQDAALQPADVFTFNLYEALASLAITVLSHPALRKVDKQPWWKKRRPTLVKEAREFDMQVLQWIQSSLAGRVQALVTLPPFLETDDKGMPVFSDSQILGSIQDLQTVNSRAGLYIWLSACLFSRPFTDDASMLGYLQTRFSGDIHTLIGQLLLASFDLLTNHLRQKETESSIRVVRSFICNKLPTLLAIVAGSMTHAVPVEAALRDAFPSITIDVLPPITAGATEIREKLKTTRLEFLQACMLHGIMSEGAVLAIIHEPLPPSKATRYSKNGLLAKFTNNMGAVDGLVTELQGMQGNADAIAGFLIETIGNLCINRDTISLKMLCNMLTRKIAAVDIILQYTSTIQLLSPLCNQLDTWNHDQDQMEFTPSYEEFSSILLFILAVVHRYDLATADLGLANDETFVSKMLDDNATSFSPSDLSDEQSAQLGKWIEGLYTTDEHGETGGIGDEVMRPCPPQAFFPLVPTLFEQSVIARRSGVLSIKAFKGGLELLVEPFLLPSLVPGLSWLVKHSWEDHEDADVLLQLLEKLIKPSSSSPETKAMHHAILGIVADPLYYALQTLRQRRPEKKETDGLLETLRPFLHRSRSPKANREELDMWTEPPQGGIARCLQNTIRDLVTWVTTTGPNPPPKYTHKLFHTACEVLGPGSTLDAIIAELMQQTKDNNGAFAMDICAAMICAPTRDSLAMLTQLPTPSAQAMMGSSPVREALRLRCSRPQHLLQEQAASAESLVRLFRRVEAQLTITHMPQIALPLPLHKEAADQIMADLGLTDANMAAAAQDANITVAGGDAFDNADLTTVLEQPLSDEAVQSLANMSADVSGLPSTQTQDIFGDLGMDNLDSLAAEMSTADGAGAGGSNQGEQNAEDDIFAELDMNNLDFGFS